MHVLRKSVNTGSCGHALSKSCILFYVFIWVFVLHVFCRLDYPLTLALTHQHQMNIITLLLLSLLEDLKHNISSKQKTKKEKKLYICDLVRL